MGNSKSTAASPAPTQLAEVLIDCDSIQFQDRYVRQGARGGRKAVEDLFVALQSVCNLFPLDAGSVHVIVRRGKVKAAFPDGSSTVSSMSREPSMRRLQMSVQVDASRSTTSEGKHSMTKFLNGMMESKLFVHRVKRSNSKDRSITLLPPPAQPDATIKVFATEDIIGKTQDIANLRQEGIPVILVKGTTANVPDLQVKGVTVICLPELFSSDPALVHLGKPNRPLPPPPPALPQRVATLRRAEQGKDA